MRPLLSSSLAAVGVACALVVSACTETGSGSSETAVTGPEAFVPEQTAPPERLTPFCQEMIDLAEDLESNPPDDVGAFVLARYQAVAESVPEAIADDFAAVVADLSGRPVPTVATTAPDSTTGPTTGPTTDPTTGSSTPGSTPEGDEFFDEGYSPGQTPAERVNAYVAFTCRATANNPGPPATQPNSDQPTTTP